MSRIAIFTFLLLAAGTPLAAQVEEFPMRELEETVAARAADVARLTERLNRSIPRQAFSLRQYFAPVTYTISGGLPSSSSATPALPLDIVSAVRGDEHLASLHVESRSGGPRRGDFTATFTFNDLSEFDSWYASSGAQSLHRVIEAAAEAGEIEIDLSVNPQAANAPPVIEDTDLLP